MPQHDPIEWRARTRLEKYDQRDLQAAGLPDKPTAAQLDAARDAGHLTPTETIEQEGNLLMYGGASALWDLLTAGGNVTAFSNANAHIGVGDSSTAAAATQTDLQAATNKDRQPMESGYPTHTDGTTSGSHEVTFRSVWGSAEGNFAWNEWGVFNAATAGRMLNRKVENLGTKAAGTTWTLTVTIGLS